MAVPKKRTSLSKKRQRRSSKYLAEQRSTILCSNCSANTFPHAVCISCGYYKGKSYIKRI